MSIDFIRHTNMIMLDVQSYGMVNINLNNFLSSQKLFMDIY